VLSSNEHEDRAVRDLSVSYIAQPNYANVVDICSLLSYLQLIMSLQHANPMVGPDFLRYIRTLPLSVDNVWRATHNGTKDSIQTQLTTLHQLLTTGRVSDHRLKGTKVSATVDWPARSITFQSAEPGIEWSERLDKVTAQYLEIADKRRHKEQKIDGVGIEYTNHFRRLLVQMEVRPVPT
jgi:hypothetical protein